MGVLVIFVLVFTVFCIVCTVYFCCFVYGLERRLSRNGTWISVKVRLDQEEKQEVWKKN